MAAASDTADVSVPNQQNRGGDHNGPTPQLGWSTAPKAIRREVSKMSREVAQGYEYGANVVHLRGSNLKGFGGAKL